MNIFKDNWQWWILAFVGLPLAVLMVQDLSWSQLTLDEKGALALFPYLGIGAWSVMWTHYAAGLARKTWDGLKPSKLYSKVSHGLVTFLLLAHPLLLVFAQYQLTGDVPPESFENYVGSGALIAVYAGTVALIIFLSYDVYRKLRSSEFWRKQEWLVSISQTLAMSLIFWHGLRLGQHLGNGWFRYWWIGLGLVLLVGQYSDIKRALNKRFPEDAAA